MPNRGAGGVSYRYWFNGKETENDVKGIGNVQDYGMRIYDPRLGRFLSVDPLKDKYPELTTYQFASNRPIEGVDLDGMELAYAARFQLADINYKADLATRAAQGDIQAEKLYNNLINVQLRIVKAEFILVSTYMSIGSMSFAGSFTSKAIFGTMNRMLVAGGIGASVNLALSYSRSEQGYELIKSGLSGFLSGATLGLPWTKSMQGIVTAGAMSGMVGDITNQVFDYVYGEDNGFSLERTLTSGGIGAVANVLSNILVSQTNAALSQKLAEKISETNSSTYRSTIREAILKNNPNIGRGAQLRKAVNQEIKRIQQLLRRDSDNLKILTKQMIERAIDALQDQTNESIKPTTGNGK